MSAAATAFARPALTTAELARAVAAAVLMLLVAYSVLIWPLLYAEPVFTTTFAYAPPNADGGSYLLTRIYVPILFVVALAAFAAAHPVMTRREANLLLWFGAFFGLAAASSLWSLDGGFTLRKTVYQSLIVATVAMSVVTARNPRRILLFVFGLVVVAVLANLAAVATRPPGPIGHEGIYDHKNTLGSNMAVAFVFGLFVLVFERGLLRAAGLFVLAAAVVLLLASQSKTAMGVSALAPFIGTGIYLTARWLRVPPVISIVFAFLLGVPAYLIVSRLFGFGTSDILLFAFNDETFTGRTDIWSFTWNHIQNRPLLGHGYQGFWGIPDSPKLRAEEPFIAKMAHGHNGFLDTLLGSGIVGLALYLVLIGKVLGNCGRLAGRAAGLSWLYLTLACLFLIVNLMESTLLLTEDVEDITFILIGFLAAGTTTPERAATPAQGDRPGNGRRTRT